MAHITEDRILETSTSTGTGAFTLTGAVPGFRAFSAKMAVSDTCHYMIEAVDGDGLPTGDWETGRGTYSGTNTLTRTTVIRSSNSDAAVTFAAGDKRVALVIIAPASAALQADWKAALGLNSNVQAVTSSGTVTPTFLNDLVKITAQAAALALANPTGTVMDGWGMVIRIKDNGTARAITYGTQYRAIGVTLPTTTIVGKTVYLAMIYNSEDTKWDVIAVGQEA